MLGQKEWKPVFWKLLAAAALTGGLGIHAGQESPPPKDAAAHSDNAATRPSEKASAALASLSWLRGVWRGPHESGEWEACYTSCDGGLLLSANKEIKGGRVVMIEFERFKVHGEDLFMTPYPYGRESKVQFRMIENDPAARRAVFANPEHDFPKRIVYHRKADDRLLIEVEGEQRGQAVHLTLDLTLQN